MEYVNFLNELKHGIIHIDGIVNKIKPDFIETALNAIPFVFEPINKVIDASKDASFDGELDLPFQTCFFELLNGYPLESMNDKVTFLDVKGYLVHESSPRAYVVYILFYDRRLKSFSIGSTIKSKELFKHHLSIINSLLQRLSKAAIGHYNPHQYVKVKNADGSKQGHRINKVIYVSNTRSKDKLESVEGRRIDYSHRWSVRGHWRSIPGRLGRDRSGEVIADWTWVRDHVKGPEEAVLVPKVRLVKQGQGGL